MRYESQRLAGRAKSTQLNVKGQLEKFRQWVTSESQPNVYLRDIDDLLVSRYFLRLLPPAFAESTFNLYRGHIVAFFEFCRAESWILTNPCRFVDKQTEPEGSPKLRLSASELLTMLRNASSPRNRIALAIGMNTGIRSSEARAIKVGDVNLTNDLVAIYRPKTKQYSQFPITGTLHEELLSWFTWYAEELGHDSIAGLPNNYTLIPPLRGLGLLPGRTVEYRVEVRPYGIHGCLERIVQHELQKLGYPLTDPLTGKPKREGFHTLRRSAGRAVYELAVSDGNDDPIRVAMAFLGHKNQATTEIYLGIQRDEQARNQLIQSRPFLERVAELDAARILRLTSSAERMKVARNA